MAEIQHELKIHASRAKVVEALTTLPALERWSQAKVTGRDHEWTIVYPDGPTFRWSVVNASNDEITWSCEEGPGNAKGSQVIFTFSDTDKSRTHLRLAHRERSGEDPNHHKCNTLWGILLGRIQQEAERSQG